MKRNYRLNNAVKLAASACLTAGALTACGSTTAPSATGGHKAKITISIEGIPGTGAMTSSDNKALLQDTKAYEAAHPNVKIKWLENTYTAIEAANAALVTRAAGGADPNIVWEQYGPVNSGSIPSGILQNLTSYLNQKDPYDTAYPTWLDTFKAIDYPYMKSPNGNYDVILSSDIATGIYYNKAAFAKAGITGTPSTWAQWIADMKKLKASGITPFLFTTGGDGSGNPSWYERKLSSSILAHDVTKIDVNHAQVLTGLDVATGVAKGILSMKNPAYAEIWKLLGSLRPYLASGASEYTPGASPTSTTPPLSPEPLLVHGKVAMLWGDSVWGPQLDALGYSGKWGVFPFPTVTKATTPYATGVNVQGTVGGPNGDGQWSLTTQKADSSMTPAATKASVNFLEYLTSPKLLSAWLVNANGGAAFVPLVKGATVPADASTVESLIPKAKPPVTVEGLLDEALSASGTANGGRLVEDYVNGNLSFKAFASQWDSVMRQAAIQWVSTNHANVPGLGG